MRIHGIYIILFLISNLEGQAQTNLFEVALLNQRYELLDEIAESEFKKDNNENIFYIRKATAILNRDPHDGSYDALKLLSKVDTTALPYYNKANYYSNLSVIFLLIDEVDSAIDYMKIAQLNYSKANRPDLYNSSNLAIHQFDRIGIRGVKRNRKFLDRFYKNALIRKDSSQIWQALKYLASVNMSVHNDSTYMYYWKALNWSYRCNYLNRVASDHYSLGNYFHFQEKNMDSALYHLDKSIAYKKELGHTVGLYTSLMSKAKILLWNGDTLPALSVFKTAATIDKENISSESQYSLSLHLHDIYSKIGPIDSAYKYAAKVNSRLLKRNFLRNSNLGSRLKIAEWDKQKELTQIQKTHNRKLLLGAIAIFIFIILVFKNMFSGVVQKRKAIEAEKNLLLKSQELKSFDAMIQGQEQERKRIALELHDNLGSLLATLKLYVQNLKIRKSNFDHQYDSIVGKTELVLDEAYAKVRNIAHSENKGAIGTEGLVSAIKSYAAKISESNQILIEVEDHDMDIRLDRTIETNLFRIVQELLTNIIKHAQADETTVNITNHESSINIIVEDNGIGFDTQNSSFSHGLGYQSIQRRLDEIHGKWTVDTTPGKGSTVIINIPYS